MPFTGELDHQTSVSDPTHMLFTVRTSKADAATSLDRLMRTADRVCVHDLTCSAASRISYALRTFACGSQGQAKADVVRRCRPQAVSQSSRISRKSAPHFLVAQPLPTFERCPLTMRWQHYFLLFSLSALNFSTQTLSASPFGTTTKLNIPSLNTNPSLSLTPSSPLDLSASLYP